MVPNRVGSHGAYREEWIDDCTNDWRADLERGYDLVPAAGGEGT